MTLSTRTGSALLTLLVAFPVLAAPPAAKVRAKKPAAGTLAVRTLPGGWLAQIAGSSEHVALDVPGYAPASGRVLLLTSATSDDYEQLLASNVTLLDAAGKTVRVEALAGNRPYDGDLSPDGRLAAVLAHPFAATGEEAFVFAIDDAGKKWRKPANPESRVLAGNNWIALARPPVPLAAAHDDEERPATRPPAVPAIFLARDGSPMKPPQPIAGALAKSETVLASVGNGKLTLHDAKLAKRASADVPFLVAFPSVAANGSLIAVADYSADSAESSVLLFDGAAKPLGKFSMKAFVGVAVALAPDGSAVLAAPGSLPTGPVAASTGSDELAVALLDRTGKERWRYKAARRAPDEVFVALSVAKGGVRSAVALATSDEEKPSKVLVFDDKGRVIYEAEGELEALWLDASGEWLYTVEPGAVSRLKVSALKAGTAFPDEEDTGGEDVEAEIDAEDAREFPSGTPETFPDDEPTPAPR